MQQRHSLTWAFGYRPIGGCMALLLCISVGWAGQASADQPDNELAIPASVSATPFSSEREAVIWRRETFKDIESLLRQLRFDLVNNQDIEAAQPRLRELQEKASGANLLPAFIAGTHGNGSDARDSIWEEWDDFSGGFTDLEKSIADLIEVAEQNDPRATAQALAAVGASCKSCHRSYRYD